MEELSIQAQDLLSSLRKYVSEAISAEYVADWQGTAYKLPATLGAKKLLLAGMMIGRWTNLFGVGAQVHDFAEPDGEEIVVLTSL